MLLYVEFEVSMAAESLHLKIPESTSHTTFTKKTELGDLSKSGNHRLSVREVPCFQTRKSHKVAVVQFIFRDGETKIQKELP